MPRLQGLEYGPAPEGTAKQALQWLKDRKERFGHFINGEFVFPESGTFKVNSPSTGSFLADVREGTVGDVDTAMDAAQKAFHSWSRLPGLARKEYLYAIGRAIARHERLFAVLESIDNGKPIREARIDVQLVVQYFLRHADWAQIVPRRHPNHRPGGVVGAVIPWNFPLLMLAWKVAPYIATGNTIVVKPSETTPLTAMLFGEVLQKVGLPPGVVNIVNGAGSTGAIIANHPATWKTAFTGSTEVGRLIRRATAGSGKKLSLELGGKSPFIVFADADLDSAIDGVRNAIFFNQGHVCCAGSRLIVHESIAKDFVKALKRMMEGLRAGDPLDKCTDVGAINSEAQFKTVKNYIGIAKTEGTVWQPECACPTTGYFIPPTLVTNVQPSARVAREEIFGPVLVVHTFRTPDEAITIANNTRYGLAASVWTENVSTIGFVDAKIRAGTVWNNCTNLFDANAGFGGYQESGFGREGGEEGILCTMKEMATSRITRPELDADTETPPIRLESITRTDTTLRFLVGGKLCRPDGGMTFSARDFDGKHLVDIGNGNRKDVRNAVRAARQAFAGWSHRTAHNRAQILDFLAENMSGHTQRLAHDLYLQLGRSWNLCTREVRLAIERARFAAGMADKFEGRIHQVNIPNMEVKAVKEAVGVIGIRSPDDYPLLGIMTLIGPALSMGNSVVLVAGRHSLVAMDLVRIIENSDVPDGVINILAAEDPDELAAELAKHEDVDAVWCFGDEVSVETVERESACNMKRTLATHDSNPINWDNVTGMLDLFYHAATQVKNIWTPYGV